MKKYLYIVIALGLIVGISKSIYDEVNKKSAKSTRLECHKYATVFERVLKKDLINKFQEEFLKGKVSLSIDIEKAKYMESKLFEHIDIKKLKAHFEREIGIVKSKENYPISLDIIVYENDKNDPGKKTKKSKLYAGYLVLSAKVDNTLVYKLQIDFLDEEGKDIARVSSCAIESIKTLQGDK